MNIVIIGNSAAGLSVAETIRQLKKDASITIKSKNQKRGQKGSSLLLTLL
ncbi:hypothetical protein MHK_005528 [Candidatus Magnetomorum sp. HK-1]|nr:hypothetical protein MHK_005528 [Candidatus Magnetomorum sp. HK-1]